MPNKAPQFRPAFVKNRPTVRPRDNRQSAARRGYGHKWRKARLGHLKKNPLCVECLKLGRVTAATVVDHKVPHKGDMKLFWDKTNWQSMCENCHNIKTAKEDGGFGNEQTSKRT